MISLKRTALAVGAAALMTFSLTACGSSASGAPTNASKADFCSAYKSEGAAFNGLDKGDYAGLATAMHSFADKLKSVGTPAGMPSDARAGFEAMVGAASNADAGKIKDGVAQVQAAMKGSSSPSDSDVETKLFGMSSSDVKNAEAFDKYAAGLCD
ncbi:MAG: hypothetical protein FWD95_13325 [Nocardioidaceae bacterium]|nr:hypothetical protein [Nocardioidaceae bacterium]